MPSKKSLFVPGVMLLALAALLLAGRKNNTVGEAPCDKATPNCCLPKTTTEEVQHPHHSITNFILQI
jgi:hypothetical protein